MALSPPSTATPPSLPSSYENLSNVSSSNGNSWPDVIKSLPASELGWGASWPWPASYPTRGASTTSSLQRMGPLWSHISFNAKGAGKSRWWQGGHVGSQSTSLTYTSLPITHTSQLTPWGHGSFSCSAGQPQGSTPLQKPSMSCPTGSPTPRSYATRSGKKNDDKLRQKSVSSLDAPPFSRSLSTTVGANSKPGGSPSWCTALKVTPTSPVAKGKLCAKDAASALTLPELLSRGEVMSPPQHAEKLLYDKDRCTCDLKWHCIPHDACFIHNSCFCKGSGSFHPVKPLHQSWSDFSYEWYCELVSCLELHPHSLLPCFGSEVEYSPLVMPYYCVPPPAD